MTNENNNVKVDNSRTWNKQALTTWTLKTEQATLMKQSFLNEAKHRYQLLVDTLAKQMSFQTTFMESLILAQDERWRRA